MGENAFRAFRVHLEEEGFSSGIDMLNLSDLPDNEVTIEVFYSSVNYKDGLASTPKGKVVSSYPLILGIDLAGRVVASRSPEFQAGDEVLCTGYGLGVSHDGGYAEFARVPAEWLVKLPEGLTHQESMAIGTAGFTAALSVERLLQSGVQPGNGPVLVRGATGGVGSIAVNILSRLGFEVVASTGKPEAETALIRWGASSVISRDAASASVKGALGKSQWAAAIDPVGGAGTGEILKTVKYGGTVALSGLTGGGAVETSVFPFILRGVNLLGIDSVYCPQAERLELWKRLGSEWKPEQVLQDGVKVYELEQLEEALSIVLNGKAIGRQVVSLRRDK
ncbi:acrylyl-CoA reductase family protein [Paenibacillus bouchesdurhonensis]|uniref:acrylyl-CoA reductase family protein n=1 Tax=Paenibacillus bouchesdurhonensis TaxID=1870990 RepID=UPI000DA62C36|nr:acryloyl-CoA reductase [Paenibacillus bouchesdurhonensis]